MLDPSVTIKDEAKRVSEILRALGSPGRVEVLLRVSGGASCRADLAGMMGVTVAEASRCACRLVAVGLLDRVRSRQERPLTLTPLGLAAVEAVRGLAK